MGRILPFYRTGGVVSGGGGGGGNTGVPLGPFNDWSELPASAQGGALAFVASLGPLNSYGTARYEAAGPVEWQLFFGYFETLADLLAFAEPINPLAVATVGVSLDAPDSVRYQWDDPNVQWLRTPDPVPFAWTLSSTRDFSAIGLQDGDFGIYTPSGGEPVLLRYVAACTAVGGGTLPAWVIPDMYGRANLQIVCYVEGSETPPAYGGTRQGYQYDRTGAATITSVSGYMRMDAPAPGAGSQFAFMTSPAISGSKRFYVQTEVRGVTAGTVGQAGFFDLSSVGISQWALASQRNVSSAVVLPIGWNGSAYVAGLTGTAVRNGGIALPASTPWLVEGYSSGGAITDMMATRIDGFSYCALRRNFDSATVSTNFNVVPYAGGNVSGTSSGQLEIRRHYVFTSD
jgi:hypothetical protein